MEIQISWTGYVYLLFLATCAYYVTIALLLYQTEIRAFFFDKGKVTSTFKKQKTTEPVNVPDAAEQNSPEEKNENSYHDQS